MANTDLIENTFPYPLHSTRIGLYSQYQQLLEGQHWDAFAVQGEKDFTERYKRLRYVVANFAGLVSKVIADILFGEPIRISAGDNQEWVEDLVFKNQLQTLNYESAMSNSAKGDALYKILVRDKEIIIDDVNPSIYFPHINLSNPRRKPEVEELAWTEVVGKTKYLIREIYIPGYVMTKVHELDGKNNVDHEIGVADYNKIAGTNYVASVETGIKKNLLIHVPNYRYSGRYFGVSDYVDIQSLQFALNNRITKIDNVLDKHTDPILAVPEGILDEEGKVKKKYLEMVELANKDVPKPEYIVWDASLESAFKEIDKLVEFLFMFSETSPDALGMGKSGQAESGRALKMRLLRTIAKKNRKQRYYDQGIKETLLIAQELSRAKGYTVNGKKCPTDAVIPSLTFSDGVVNDSFEDTQIETMKIEAGITTKKKAIMRLDEVEEAEAEETLKEINAESATV
jgi:SPP1 family phage portal protein